MSKYPIPDRIYLPITPFMREFGNQTTLRREVQRRLLRKGREILDDLMKNKPKRYKKTYIQRVPRTKILSERGNIRYCSSKKGPKSKKSLKSKVNLLMKRLPPKGTKSFRQLNGKSIACAANQCAYSVDNVRSSVIIDRAIDSLQYLDRGVTPALKTLDFTNLGVKTQLKFKNFYVRTEFRNNNTAPIVVDYYIIKCKERTSLDGPGSMTNGDELYGITDADTNLMTFPTDFIEFNDRWKILKHCTVELNGGDHFTEHYGEKMFKYDPEVHEDSGQTYNPGDIQVMVRIRGCVAHDQTTEENVGYTDGSLDYVTYVKFDVDFPSDIAAKQIETFNSLDTLTTAETVGINIVPRTDLQ